jgi:hypothetical protein
LGDAFLPLGDDAAAALFYNPASIGRIRRPQAEGVNLSFYGNSDYLDLFSLNSFGYLGVAGLSGIASTLQENPTKMTSIGGALLPAFGMENWAMGVLVQTQLRAQVKEDGTLSYSSRYQLIPALATGIRLAGGIVRLGYSLHWVNQAVGTIEGVSPSAAGIGYNQNIAQGSAFSHNAGFALTLPYEFLPSFNLVARNIFGTEYQSSTLYSFTPTPNGVPATEPMTFDASISVQPKVGSGAYFNFVLQDRDLVGKSGVSIFGRLALAAEFSFRDMFFLRSGWGSGYPSLGIGLRRANGGDLSLTWYSEEVGSGYHSVRDLRYLFQYQLRSF